MRRRKALASLIVGTLAMLAATPAAQAFEPVGTTSGFASRLDRAAFAERKAERKRKKEARAQAKAQVEAREDDRAAVSKETRAAMATEKDDADRRD